MDETGDSNGEPVFENGSFKELSSLELQEYREKKIRELRENANRMIVKTVSEENTDFYTAVCCCADLNEGKIEAAKRNIQIIRDEYSELEQDGVWRKHMEDCISLIEKAKAFYGGNE